MRQLANKSGQSAGAGSDQAGIQEVLHAYEAALNAANVDAVLAVFAPDAVFMAPNSPSAVGADAIRAAYTNIFKAIGFETELQVEEVVRVAPTWAFVRTSSNGFVTVHAIKQRVPDANHELFILHKSDGGWKVARYSFATTNPLPQ